jgi:hypothetical protein
MLRFHMDSLFHMSDWSLATSLRLSSGFLSPARPTTGQFLETDRDRLCSYSFQLIFLNHSASH